VAKGRDAKVAANWITGDLFAALNRAGRTIADSPVSAASLGKLLDLIADNTISGRIAKDVFEAMVETGNDPAHIVEQKGLRQVTDTGAIDAAVDSVLEANPVLVEQYKTGKEKLFGAFVGQVMKAMKGKGNPALVNESLRRKLS
jgi:aspartyl-tRNA(Asn)/glutamyl-tRNA(Gln) amidotransferase subunit B